MKKIFTTIIFICLMLMSSIAYSETIYVDDDNIGGPWDGTAENPYRYIQDGIDAASEGDTLLVAEGTYDENPEVGGKTLYLFGGFENVGWTRDINAHETIIDGGSRATTVRIDESATVIDGFTVQNGQAGTHGGGGIDMSGGAPEIRYCTIKNNSAIGEHEWGGGGILIGGGIAKILHCNIIDNHSPGGASGIRAGSCDILIKNTLIASNRGAAALHIHSSKGDIINCTIANNDGKWAGGNPEPINFRNCILWNNPSGGWKGNSFSYSDVEEKVSGVGNINQEPLFVDEGAGDYHLQPGSPCIDTGSPNSFDNDVDGTRNDMGVYGGNPIIANLVSYDFGVVALDYPKKVDLVIANTDESDFVIDDLQWTDDSDFSISETAPITIQPGESKAIAVTFQPQVVSPQSSTLTVFSDDFYGATQAEVSFIGRGPNVGTGIGGELSGTLTVENSPYLVMDDISVADGETLVIEPGVQMRFGGKYQFDVYGTLQAIGTKEESVLFTSNQTNPKPGDWRSINFVNSEDSTVQYCRLEYGSRSKTGYWYYGVINCDNSSPMISDNVIVDNESCGIVCHESSNPTISHNHIANNGWIGVKIHNNSSPMVVGNVISNNSGNGIEFNSGGNPSIINNVISNNAESGIRAWLAISSDSVNNNTIYGNSVGFDVGEANVTVRNCIVWGNNVGMEIDPSANFSITYSDVQGGWPGEGNIDINPLFVHDKKENYYLSDFSHCIGAGTSENTPPTDINGNPRGTPPDMGAYEHPRDVPRLIGDVSGNDAISALDAAIILQYVVGLIDQFPIYVTISPSDFQPQSYTLSVPQVSAKIGERIRVPIMVDDMTALMVGGFKLGYDATILRAVDALPTKLLNGAYWKANIDLDSEIRFAFATTESTKGEGALLMVEFEVIGTIEDAISPLTLDADLPGSLDVKLHHGSVTVLPSRTLLLPNYPNPFNPETWLPYQLASDAPVTINIYNAKGQLIRAISLGNKNAGVYVTKDKAAHWNGRDNLGEKVASGVYFYQLQAGDFSAVRRMVIGK